MVNWYMVQCDSFTAIRAEFSVKLLESLMWSGNTTPVSGDALARRKADLAIARGLR